MKTPKVSVKFAALGVFVCVLVVGCSRSDQALLDHLVIGEPFPDIQLTDFEGERTSLASFRGKLVVLNLWATWCEPCRREMPALQALSDALDPQRFVVLGLSVDEDVHVVREFLLEREVSFSNYIDPGGELVSRELGVRLYPYTLLIGPDGHFIQRVPGAREWHSEEVVVLLEQAYQGDYSGLRVE